MKSYNIDLNNIHVNCVVVVFLSYRFISLSLYSETYHFNHTFTYSLTYLSTIITGIFYICHYYFLSQQTISFLEHFCVFFKGFWFVCALIFHSIFFVICACTGSSPSSSYKVTHSKK